MAPVLDIEIVDFLVSDYIFALICVLIKCNFLVNSSFFFMILLE